MSGDHNMNQTDSGWRKRQIALDIKAKNARELGLDYEPSMTKDEDDDTQGFEPEWANFREGRAVGWTEAFLRIAEKIKEMPWETDTKDSFLVWLQEQK